MGQCRSGGILIPTLTEAAGGRRLGFHGVTFRYSRRSAPVLRGFTWQLPLGRTVLLGPNGAGKSTLLSLAADALRPQAGEIHIGSLNPARRRDRSEYRRAVGWMPQQVRAVPGLGVREQVAYSAWLKGLSTAESWIRAEAALEQVDLLPLASRRTSQLSGGQLRRVGLAQVLAHDAEMLLLDEPTAGLDPAQRARFRKVLGGIGTDRPVVVSTHQVDDLDELYDSVVVLDDGAIRFEGSLASFMSLAPLRSARPAEDAYARLVHLER